MLPADAGAFADERLRVFLDGTVDGLDGRFYYIDQYSPNGARYAGPFWSYPDDQLRSARLSGGVLEMIYSADAVTSEPHSASVYALTDDGHAIGFANESGGDRTSWALLWSPDGTPQVIGEPWTFGTNGSGDQIVLVDANADASVIVGTAIRESGSRGIVWRSDGTITILGTFGDGLFPAENLRSAALFVDPSDGSVVGQASRTETETTVFRWTETDGMVDLLPNWSGGRINLFLPTVDNTAVVGRIDDPNLTGPYSGHAMKWTPDGGVEVMGNVIGASESGSQAWAGSSYGEVVVGEYNSNSAELNTFIWINGQVPQDFDQYVRNQLRVDLAEWRLRGFGISPAGDTVSGMAERGSMSAGDFEQYAFTLNITAPCDGDWIVDGNLTFFDIAAFVGDYIAASPKADLDRDGSVDTTDFDQFVAAFVSGCP